jgi:hypothetical protein
MRSAVHSHNDGISTNGIVIDSGAGVDMGGKLQCSVRTLGQGPLGALSDNNEIGSGQIAAPCAFRREVREGDFRCGCEGFVSERNKRPFISSMIIASMLHSASRSAKRRKANARHAAKGTAGGELNVSWRAVLNVGKVHTAIFHIVRPLLILFMQGINRKSL